jgi:hypothetical protein
VSSLLYKIENIFRFRIRSSNNNYITHDKSLELVVKLGIRHKCAFSPWRILIFGNIKTVFVDPTFFNLVGTAQFRDEQTRSNQLLQATFGTFNIRNCAETIYKG